MMPVLHNRSAALEPCPETLGIKIVKKDVRLFVLITVIFIVVWIALVWVMTRTPGLQDVRTTKINSVK